MRKILVALCLAMTWLTTYSQEVPCNDIAKLTTQLKSIRDSDQNTRTSLIKQMSQQPVDPARLKDMAVKMQAVDKQNQLYIGKMLDQCGWPQGLSFLENNTIFLVIDHADTTFMNKYLPLLKQQAEIGVVQKSDLATLEDRMLMRRAKKQLYGTQTFKNSRTQITTFWPIEDPDNLAERRSKMGLVTMDDYIALLKKTYGLEVTWDKNLSIEDAKNGMKKQ